MRLPSPVDLTGFSFMDGILYRKGKPVKLRISKAGYYVVWNGKRDFLYHRILFAFYTGRTEFGTIDHKDGNPLNNVESNLRECTLQDNARNVKGRSKSGHKGVYELYPDKFIVQLRLNKKTVHIGTFEDFELACLVADEAREKYHKEFANHGI